MSDQSAVKTDETLIWDACCYGWVDSDGNFAPKPIPFSWKGDSRGLQIEQSRVQMRGCAVFEYEDLNQT